MDNQRFDAFARRWATRSSRRTTIRAGAGAIAAGLATAAGARAACGRVREECDRNRDCCDGAQCDDGICRCRDGLTNCDGRCRDLQRDEDDCGRCDNACDRGDICAQGRCRDRRDVARDRCLVECIRGCSQLGQVCANRCFFIECRRELM